MNGGKMVNLYNLFTVILLPLAMSIRAREIIVFSRLRMFQKKKQVSMHISGLWKVVRILKILYSSSAVN